MNKDTESLLRLAWPVDQDGYELAEYKHESAFNPERGEELVKFLKGRGGPFREYSPFGRETAIHRDFADVGDSLESAIDFCNRYGLPDHEKPTTLDPFPRSERGGVSLRWRPNGRLMPVHETISLDYFDHLQRPVREAIQAIDDGKPRRAISLFNEQMFSVTPRIEVKPGRVTSKHHWHLIPHNLIGAIWLLIEREVTGGTEWRRCKNCDSWFVPPTARAEYCRNACKTAYFRRQKQEAADG